jgi:hypothetical protein
MKSKKVIFESVLVLLMALVVFYLFFYSSFAIDVKLWIMASSGLLGLLFLILLVYPSQLKSLRAATNEKEIRDSRGMIILTFIRIGIIASCVIYFLWMLWSKNY